MESSITVGTFETTKKRPRLKTIEIMSNLCKDQLKSSIDRTFQARLVSENRLIVSSYGYNYRAICLTDSSVFTLDHCVNFKAIRYWSLSFNRVVAYKSHRIDHSLKSFIRFCQRPYHCSFTIIQRKKWGKLPLIVKDNNRSN